MSAVCDSSGKLGNWFIQWFPWGSAGEWILSVLCDHSNLGLKLLLSLALFAVAIIASMVPMKECRDCHSTASTAKIPSAAEDDDDGYQKRGTGGARTPEAKKRKGSSTSAAKGTVPRPKKSKKNLKKSASTEQVNVPPSSSMEGLDAAPPTATGAAVTGRTKGSTVYFEGDEPPSKQRRKQSHEDSRLRRKAVPASPVGQGRIPFPVVSPSLPRNPRSDETLDSGAPLQNNNNNTKSSSPSKSQPPPPHHRRLPKQRSALKPSPKVAGSTADSLIQVVSSSHEASHHGHSHEGDHSHHRSHSAHRHSHNDEEHDDDTHPHDSHHYHGAVQYGTAFSAGVFLSMGLLHLLPEATEDFTTAYGAAAVSTYRPEYLTCIVGYAVILAIQRVVFPTPTCPNHAVHSAAVEGNVSDRDVADNASLAASSVDWSHLHHHRHVGGDDNDHTERAGLLSEPRYGTAPAYGTTTTGEEIVSLSPMTVTPQASHQLSYHPHHHHHHQHHRPYLMQYGGEEDEDDVPMMDTPQMGASDGTSSMAMVSMRSTPYGEGPMTTMMMMHSAAPLELPPNSAATLQRNTSGSLDDIAMISLSSQCHSLRHCREAPGQRHWLLDRPERMAQEPSRFTLAIALSVHAVCEGVALGMQCGADSTLLLATGVLFHKWAESFALASSLANQPTMKKRSGAAGMHPSWRLLIGFACATPAGVLLAALLHQALPSSSVAYVKAVSAGTFLYIGASEVVVEEFVEGKQYWGKWWVFLFGVFTMYGLTVLFH